MHKIRVAIIDDHKLVSDSFASLLQQEEDMQLVLKSDKGQALVDALDKDNSIDVVVLDFDMPGMSGLDVIKAIKNKMNRPKVLIVSMHKEAQLVRELHREGINGYVLKDEDSVELLKGIRSVAEGEEYWGKGVAKILLNNPSAKDANGNEFVVTDRELEVLSKLGEGKSSKEIADALFVSVNTVDTHRRNLMAKFGVKNVVQLVLAGQKAKII